MEKSGSPKHGNLGIWLLGAAVLVLLLGPMVSKAQEPEWRTAPADDGLAAAQRVQLEIGE